jgi:hypothetical protein
MALVILRPTLSNRRSTGASLPVPALVLPPTLRTAPHLPLVPPPARPVVSRPAYRRREVPRAPVIRLPGPTLQLPAPQPPALAPEVVVRPLADLPPRLLPAVLGPPAPLAAVKPIVPAFWVGITGGQGTTVSASPADLTVGPITDISNFRVSMDSGVYG